MDVLGIQTSERVSEENTSDLIKEFSGMLDYESHLENTNLMFWETHLELRKKAEQYIAKVKAAVDEVDNLLDEFRAHRDLKQTHGNRGSEEISVEINLTLEDTDDYIDSQRVSEELAVESHPIPNHAHTITIEEAITNTRFVTTLAEKTKLLILSVRFYSWLFRMLNVFIEILQAILSQESARGKINGHVYRRLSVITSSICFLISLVEFIHEAIRSRVVWRNRGRCCWFYHPGSRNRLFGNFLLYFGVLSSAIQFSINLLMLIFNNNFIAFDLFALCFAASCLFTSTADNREETAEPNAEFNSHTHLP